MLAHFFLLTLPHQRNELFIACQANSTLLHDFLLFLFVSPHFLFVMLLSALFTVRLVAFFENCQDKYDKQMNIGISDGIGLTFNVQLNLFFIGF